MISPAGNGHNAAVSNDASVVIVPLPWQLEHRAVSHGCPRSVVPYRFPLASIISRPEVAPLSR